MDHKTPAAPAARMTAHHAAGAIDSKRTANVADIAAATNHVKAALAEALAGKPVSVAQTRAYGCSVK